MPQLDGLRAVAVAFVMVFHFIPGVERFAPLGSVGVRLFFVISGFLITQILLGLRSRPIGDALRTFYIRRSLRIFPVFYLVLGLAALMNIGPVRDTFGWHAAYLTNFYLYERGAWHGSISHLWSLSVEEQFYLAWPFVVLWMPMRWLPSTIVAMVMLAPLSRLLIGGPMNSVLPTSCLDSLGIGALLALPATRLAMIRIGRTGPAVIVGALLLRGAQPASVPVDVLIDIGVSLSAGWLVGCAAARIRGTLGAVLELKPVCYAGTISYGLYLFHGFMPYVLGRYLPGFVDMPVASRALWLTVTTCLAAAASWHLFESPLLRLKDKWAGPETSRNSRASGLAA